MGESVSCRNEIAIASDLRAPLTLLLERTTHPAEPAPAVKWVAVHPEQNLTRSNGTNIHGPTAKRDVEGVSPEQIHHGHEYQEDRRLPALPRIQQLRFSEHYNEHDRKR